MTDNSEAGAPVRKFKLVFLGEQSGKLVRSQSPSFSEWIHFRGSSWKNLSHYPLYVRYVWQHIPGTGCIVFHAYITLHLTQWTLGHDWYWFSIKNDVSGRQNNKATAMGYCRAGRDFYRGHAYPTIPHFKKNRSGFEVWFQVTSAIHLSRLLYMI